MDIWSLIEVFRNHWKGHLSFLQTEPPIVLKLEYQSVLMVPHAHGGRSIPHDYFRNGAQGLRVLSAGGAPDWFNAGQTIGARGAGGHRRLIGKGKTGISASDNTGSIWRRH